MTHQHAQDRRHAQRVSNTRSSGMISCTWLSPAVTLTRGSKCAGVRRMRCTIDLAHSRKDLSLYSGALRAPSRLPTCSGRRTHGQSQTAACLTWHNKYTGKGEPQLRTSYVAFALGSDRGFPASTNRNPQLGSGSGSGPGSAQAQARYQGKQQGLPLFLAVKLDVMVKASSPRSWPGSCHAPVARSRPRCSTAAPPAPDPGSTPAPANRRIANECGGGQRQHDVALGAS